MAAAPDHLGASTRRRAIVGVFFVAILLLLFALTQLARTGVVIDTNLRSLAPEISQDTLGEALINELSAAASRKAMVVLATDSPAQVTAASDYLRVRLADLDTAGYGVKQTDPAESAADYVSLLEQYPDNFLRPELATLLATGDEAQLTQWVLEQLYGSAGQVRLTSFERDPFGALNDFATYLQEHLAGEQNEDVQTLLHEGVPRYFTVWQFELPEDGLALNAQAEWITELEKIRTDVHVQFADIEWLQSGMIFFAADSARAAQRNINLISAVGITGIVLMMLLVFRGVRPLFASIAAITGGVLFAFAVCHSVWGSIHILTLLFGASLIGVAVDYSLHLYYFRSTAPDTAGGVKSHFYPALLLSLLTSIVGYSALAMSGLETLQQVAVFSIAGLSFACVWVLFSEPWAVKKLVVKDRRLTRFTQSCVLRLKPLAQVKWMIAGSLALWLLVGLFAARFVVDDSPKAFVTQNPHLLENEQRLAQWLGEYEPATFILIRGTNDAEAFDKIQQLQASVSATPDLLKAAKKDLLGIHSLLPSPESQLQHHQLHSVFYTSEVLAQALVSAYEIMDAEQLQKLREQYRQRPGDVLTAQQLMQQLPGLPRLWQEQTTPTGDRQIATALLIPKNADLTLLRELVETLPQADWISLVEETREGLHHLRTTASLYLAFALLLICGIFIWRYGLRRGLVISLIPVAVIGAISLVYLVTQVPVTLFHVMAAFLVLGLGVDYLVFVAEMLEEESSLHFANALVLSAVTSSLSFGLLSLSVLPAVSAFGTTVMLGILGNLLGAFCLMSVWQTLKEKTR